MVKSLAGSFAPPMDANGPGPSLPVTGDRPARVLTGRRLLVVDDEPDVRELLLVILAWHGATVQTAPGTQEALALFDREPPDLLVSDIGMPIADGYALIQHVRARPPERGGQIPALALTAHARPEDRAQVLAAGFQTYLAKPVDPFELVASITRLLQPHAPRTVTD